MQALTPPPQICFSDDARQLPEGDRPSVKRNLSIYAGTLLVPRPPTHPLARRNRPLRHRQLEIGDYKQNRASGGPLVAKGKVMQGVTGSSPGGNDIIALSRRYRRRSLALLYHCASRRTLAATAGMICRSNENGGSVGLPAATRSSSQPSLFRVAQTQPHTGPLRHRLQQTRHHQRRPQYRLHCRLGPQHTGSLSGISSTCQTINGTSIGPSSVS